MFLCVANFVVVLVRRMTLTLIALGTSIKTFLHILNDRHKNSRHLRQDHRLLDQHYTDLCEEWAVIK